jgi:hypothetical protein
MKVALPCAHAQPVLLPLVVLLGPTKDVAFCPVPALRNSARIQLLTNWTPLVSNWSTAIQKNNLSRGCAKASH